MQHGRIYLLVSDLTNSIEILPPFIYYYTLKTARYHHFHISHKIIIIFFLSTPAKHAMCIHVRKPQIMLFPLLLEVVIRLEYE